MKEINGTAYYTKTDMQQILGCSMATINNRICAAHIDGYYICGHSKWYTAEQLKRIAEYRGGTESK